MTIRDLTAKLNNDSFGDDRHVVASGAVTKYEIVDVQLDKHGVVNLIVDVQLDKHGVVNLVMGRSADIVDLPKAADPSKGGPS